MTHVHHAAAPVAPIAAALATLVADRAPPARFARLLGSRRDGARAFAASHGQLHAVAAGPCIGCGDAHPDTAATFRWSARFTDGFAFGPLEVLLLFLGRVGVRLRSTVVTFDTTHPTCPACDHRLRALRGVANVLNFVGLFTLWVAGSTLACGVSALFYFTRADDLAFWRPFTALAAVATAFGVACVWAMRRLRVPPSLRYLGSRPFGCVSVRRSGRSVTTAV